jgi:hypothetical protein
MKNLFAYLDNLPETLGIKGVYFHLAFKALAAVAGAYLAWIILKRILLSMEKKTEENNIIKINIQIFGVFRKALFYGLI